MARLPLLPRRANARFTLFRDVYSYDGCILKLTTLAVEISERLGESVDELVDQLTVNTAGAVDGGHIA